MQPSSLENQIGEVVKLNRKRVKICFSCFAWRGPQCKYECQWHNKSLQMSIKSFAKITITTQIMTATINWCGCWGWWWWWWRLFDDDGHLATATARLAADNQQRAIWLVLDLRLLRRRKHHTTIHNVHIHIYVHTCICVWTSTNW